MRRARLTERPQRVAHVIHSLGSGGAESVLVELIEPARAAGLELVVIGLSDAEDDRTAVRLEAVGVTVHQLHASRYDPRTVLAVRDLLRAERVDLVHTHLKHADLVGGMAARLAGLPAVSTLHVIETTAGGIAQRVRVRAAIRGRSALFDRVIAVSGAQRHWYTELAGPDDRVVVLPNGVREPRSGQDGRAGLRTELGVPENGLLAVTVSLMRPEKGHAVLLDAIRRGGPGWGRIVFALAGDGPLLDGIRQQVDADPILRNRVRVLGYRNDVDALLQAADLVVHPSLADALPTALISALAAGLPVVASAVGGIGDIVVPGCGELVPAGDPEALVAAIGRVAGEPAIREVWGRQGRARYEAEFAADVWAGRLRSLYDDVLMSRGEHGGRTWLPRWRPRELRAARQEAAGRTVARHAAPTLRLVASETSRSTRSVDRAVVLSTVALSPADNGKSVVINGFLRHLVDRLGRSQVHYLHVGDPLRGLPPELAGIRVHELGRPSRREQLHGALAGAGLRGRSLQEAFTSSGRVASAVRTTLGELAPDLLVVDTIRMAQHVPSDLRPETRQVLYLDDLFSVRYRRMLAVLRKDDSGFDPLGQFCSFIPGPLRALTRWPVTRNALLRFETHRVQRSEIRASRAADLPVLLNQHEADLLETAIEAPVAVLPPLLPEPPELADLAGRSDGSGSPDYAFVGLMSIPHNHDGLMWFLDEVFGRLLALRPDARLHLIGRDADAALRRAAARWGDRVVLHGFVDDLDAALRPMTALITPLRFGSGIKIKTLDALARGLPVVTTSVGAEGIVSEARPGVMIADDPDRFAEVLAATADPLNQAAASADARACYTELFAPEPAGRAYDLALGTSPRLSSIAASSALTNASGEK